MTHQIIRSQTTADKTMEPEQLDQIIEAIIDGNYSWACFLLLCSFGYDPRDYMVRRTYYRLLRENCLDRNQKGSQKQPEKTSSVKCSSKIQNISYLEEVSGEKTEIQGGSRASLLKKWNDDFSVSICSWL